VVFGRLGGRAAVARQPPPSGIAGYNPTTYAGPGTNYPAAGSLRSGQKVAVACTKTGQSVQGPYGTTNVWDYTHLENGYVTDAHMYTGQAGAVGPQCGSAQLHRDTAVMNLHVDQPGTRALYNEIKANGTWNLRGGDRHFAGIYADKPGEHAEGPSTRLPDERPRLKPDFRSL
jgi:uncharacterized protein YraI